MLKKVIFQDLGLIDYKQAWDYQEKLFNEIIELKIKNRKLPPNRQKQTKNYLLLCEHPHVFTLGKSGSESNLLINEEQFLNTGITYYKINRGGDITYHGPGQIVGYPILNLDDFYTDIHRYIYELEESVIRTIADYGISGGRIEGSTGVWLDNENPLKARKICAIGVRTSRWVTMHGFAFNVNTELDYFKKIIPCGIADKEVTSVEKELGKKIDIVQVKRKLIKHIADIFGMELIRVCL